MTDCNVWMAFFLSPLASGIAWFLGFVGFGIGAHLYGLNGRKERMRDRN